MFVFLMKNAFQVTLKVTTLDNAITPLNFCADPVFFETLFVGKRILKEVMELLEQERCLILLINLLSNGLASLLAKSIRFYIQFLITY